MRQTSVEKDAAGTRLSLLVLGDHPVAETEGDAAPPRSPSRHGSDIRLDDPERRPYVAEQLDRQRLLILAPMPLVGTREGRGRPFHGTLDHHLHPPVAYPGQRARAMTLGKFGQSPAGIQHSGRQRAIRLDWLFCPQAPQRRRSKTHQRRRMCRQAVQDARSLVQGRLADRSGGGHDEFVDPLRSVPEDALKQCGAHVLPYTREADEVGHPRGTDLRRARQEIEVRVPLPPSHGQAVKNSDETVFLFVVRIPEKAGGLYAPPLPGTA